ncbi:MAG TPA: DUF2520 domain-containing protein [Acidimicrobiia bacterium]|nr:DUF2520 domain-containing protein [Acidimicrobiia bacterium]
MDIIVASPGRAGGALALAARDAGHEIVGVVSRSQALADRFSQIAFDTPLPDADLLVVATRDDSIKEVADRLAPYTSRLRGAVHLSGFSSVSLLVSFADRGIEVGSFHPLQTLPAPETGAAALPGSWVGVTADGALRATLWELATSLRMEPFLLADELKPTYHAAAAAASNFVVAALGLAEELFAGAGVSFAAARPLTERVVANSYTLGSGAALTGPIARGDWPTVAGQIAAARALGLGEAYIAMAQATAQLTATELPASVFRLSTSE